MPILAYTIAKRPADDRARGRKNSVFKQVIVAAQFKPPSFLPLSAWMEHPTATP